MAAVAGAGLREASAAAARGTLPSVGFGVRVGLASAAAMLEGLGRTVVGLRAAFGAGVKLADIVGAGLADCWRATVCGLTDTGTDSLGDATCDEGAALADA